MTRSGDHAISIRIVLTAWFLVGAIAIGGLFRAAWMESRTPAGADASQITGAR